MLPLSSRLGRHASLLFITGFVLAIGACKPLKESSALTEVTPFGNGEILDLTTYDDADEGVFQEMRQEMEDQGFNYAGLKSSLQDIDLPGSIRLDEAIALRLYTASAYSPINTALRTRSPSKLPKLSAIVKAAASGLNRLPAVSCTAKRGTGLPGDVVETLKQKKRFKERAFMSSSYGAQGFSGNFQMVIKSNRCRKIDWLSQYPGEKEVLFPPGSEFIVDDPQITGSGSQAKGTIYLTHTLEADNPSNEPVVEVSTGDEESGPGSLAPAGNYAPSDFIGKTYKYEGGNTKMAFEGGKKGTFSGDGNITQMDWVLSGNRITIVSSLSGKTYYFLVIAKETLGVVADSSSTNIQAYYKVTSQSVLDDQTDDDGASYGPSVVSKKTFVNPEGSKLIFFGDQSGSYFAQSGGSKTNFTWSVVDSFGKLQGISATFKILTPTTFRMSPNSANGGPSSIFTFESNNVAPTSALTYIPQDFIDKQFKATDGERIFFSANHEANMKMGNAALSVKWTLDGQVIRIDGYGYAQGYGYFDLLNKGSMRWTRTKTGTGASQTGTIYELVH